MTIEKTLRTGRPSHVNYQFSTIPELCQWVEDQGYSVETIERTRVILDNGVAVTLRGNVTAVKVPKTPVVIEIPGADHFQEWLVAHPFGHYSPAVYHYTVALGYIPGFDTMSAEDSLTLREVFDDLPIA